MANQEQKNIKIMKSNNQKFYLLHSLIKKNNTVLRGIKPSGSSARLLGFK